MVFKPAYLEVNPHAINPKDVLEGLTFAEVCPWVQQLKGDPKYSGRSGSSSQPASVSSSSKLELTLDETAADNRNFRTPGQWIKYWNKIDDGRVMASASDLYWNFKIIKRMFEQGNNEEKATAKKYIDGLREDFELTGLVSSTRLFYSANSLKVRVAQHYRCNQSQLTKETVVEAPVYRETRVKKIVSEQKGLAYLQALFDTQDEGETILKTLEFAGGKNRDNLVGWTPNTTTRDMQYMQYIWRLDGVSATGFYFYKDLFHVTSDFIANFPGCSRGVHR